jgi:hypothetical protein
MKPVVLDLLLALAILLVLVLTTQWLIDALG